MNIILTIIFSIWAMVFVVITGIDIWYIATNNYKATGISGDLDEDEEEIEEEELDSEPEEEPSFRHRNNFGINPIRQ